MSLFFVGDFVDSVGNIEYNFITDLINEHDELILNLEGPIVDINKNLPCNKYKYNLYSNTKILETFKKYRISSNLSNNHINDFNEGLNSTVKFLEQNNLRYFGTQSEPYIEISHPQTNSNYCVFAFNSKLTLSFSNKGVSTIDRYSLLKVKAYKKSNPRSMVVVSVHCGQELSHYPVPADRQLFQDFIDIGADLIIAHHPHLIQDVEIYKEKFIFYSIGNFAVPEITYLGKKLHYNNPLTNKGFMVQFSNDNAVKIHEITLNKSKNEVSYLNELNINDLLNKNLFNGFSKKQYLDFYKSNRRRSKYYPIFESYKSYNFHLKYNYILATQFIRKLLITLNLYNPYS